MPALPEQFVDKIIAWTPVGNTFRGKLATRYLFPCIFAHTALLTLMLWGGIFLGLNIYLGRPLTDGMYLAILETLVSTPLFAMLWRAWLRKRWTKKSILTSDDVYLLTAYGKEVIKLHGKKLSWHVIQAQGSPIRLVNVNGKALPEPRFPPRVRNSDVIGGILCAMYQEGGWEVFPKEAWSFFNEYPFAFRAFYSQYH